MKNKILSRGFIVADEKLNRFLQDHSEKKLFKTPTEIIYQGHIPLAAYLIVQGEVEVRKGKKILHSISGPNLLVGAQELYSNIPYNYSIFVKTPSEIIILSRSDLREAMEQGHLAQLADGLQSQCR